MVIQFLTRSPNRWKSSSAYATKSLTMRSVLENEPYSSSRACGWSQWKMVTQGVIPSAIKASI